MARIKFQQEIELSINVVDENENVVDTTTGVFKIGEIVEISDWSPCYQQQLVGPDVWENTTVEKPGYVDLKCADRNGDILEVPLSAIYDMDGTLGLPPFPDDTEEDVVAADPELRSKHLEMLSGLTVTHTYQKNQNHFEFRYMDRIVIAFFTYPKALAFAKGVKFGRTLT
jgi:hypothetical protein